MLEGVKIVIDKLKANDDNAAHTFESWDGLAEEILRRDWFTEEEKAATQEALTEHRRTQFNAKVLSVVFRQSEPQDPLMEDKWWADAIQKQEGTLVKPQKILVTRAQAEIARKVLMEGNRK